MSAAKTAVESRVDPSSLSSPEFLWIASHRGSEDNHLALLCGILRAIGV